MRKLIICLLAAFLSMSFVTAEAAQKKHDKKHHVHKSKKHKHVKNRVKYIIVGAAPATQVIQLPPTPQCGFLFFKTDCNTDVRNNIRAAEKYDGMTAKTHRKELYEFMGIDPARIAWCAGFVNSVLRQNGYTTTDSLMAASYLRYGEVTHKPQAGDIVVFKRLGRGQVTGHVGFYVDIIEQDGVKYVLSLGGNQDHGVNISAYPLSKVQGFRHPV